MKKSYTVKIACTALVIVGSLYSCREASNERHNDLHREEKASTPVNTGIPAHIPAVIPEKGTRIYTAQLNGVVSYDSRNKSTIASRVAGRIERLVIKYNFQPVKKGQLIMEIYSPDLAAAQRDLLFIAGKEGLGDLLNRAKQRLQLLGMQPTQIDNVLRTGNIIYRVPVYSNSSGYILEQNVTPPSASAPASMLATTASAGDGMNAMNSSAPVTQSPANAANPSAVLLREGQYVNAGQPLFTIYQTENMVAEFSITNEVAVKMKKGQKLLFYPSRDKNKIQHAPLGLIEPVLRNGQRFMIGRVYLKNANLRPGELLTAQVPVIYENGWWIPKRSLWRLGNRSIVFRKTGNTYVPTEVEAGVELHNMVPVTTDIGQWEIASNASYLVDSESFIKTDHQPE